MQAHLLELEEELALRTGLQRPDTAAEGSTSASAAPSTPRPRRTSAPISYTTPSTATARRRRLVSIVGVKIEARSRALAHPHRRCRRLAAPLVAVARRNGIQTVCKHIAVMLHRTTNRDGEVP